MCKLRPVWTQWGPTSGLCPTSCVSLCVPDDLVFAYFVGYKVYLCIYMCKFGSLKFIVRIRTYLIILSISLADNSSSQIRVMISKLIDGRWSPKENTIVNCNNFVGRYNGSFRSDYGFSEWVTEIWPSNQIPSINYNNMLSYVYLSLPWTERVRRISAIRRVFSSQGRQGIAPTLCPQMVLDWVC